LHSELRPRQVSNSSSVPSLPRRHENHPTSAISALRCASSRQFEDR
jgi:hypothetical protein